MNTLNRPIARKSLPLSERDQRDLALLRTSAAHRNALAHLSESEVSASISEAALLHAVLEAGIKAVEQRVEEEGYAAIASQMDMAARRSVARRRRPAWADE